jgi:hypothetical protein
MKVLSFIAFNVNTSCWSQNVSRMGCRAPMKAKSHSIIFFNAAIDHLVNCYEAIIAAPIKMTRFEFNCVI